MRLSQYKPSLPLLMPAEKFMSRMMTSIGEVLSMDMIWLGLPAVLISLNSVSNKSSSDASTPLLSSTIKIVPFSGVYLNALEMRLFSIFVKQLLSLLHIILGLTSVWRRILFCSANSLNDSIISCDNSLIFNSCIWHV